MSKTSLESSDCLWRQEGETLINVLPAILSIAAVVAAITAAIIAVADI